MAALEPTTVGTLHLDAFESRRWTRIGWALVFDDVPFSHLFCGSSMAFGPGA